MLLRFLFLTFFIFQMSSVHAEDHGVKLPPGFKITQFSDEKLANDIYAMTLDAQGRVVVTSRGWVKRLEDTDGDGKADKATIIAETKSGGMGMLFDGDSLYITCDGGLKEYSRSKKGDDSSRYDNPKEWFPLHFSEHGAHAIRKGPDGRLYVIAGNDAGLSKLKFCNISDSSKIEGGGIFSFDPTAKPESKPVLHAQGFRNPYDFDFTPLGDIITYDSDTERDYLLPWYMPTRLYHVGIGQHHGWRLPGYLRSLPRPDYYADTVDILHRVGRGSPTGVVCYRHTQFPTAYRGGVFILDWTFGNIWYYPLQPEGTTYKTKPELFLEPTGSSGFAPTDVCVALDGSLYVSIGGRGTRGSVYKIEYVGKKEIEKPQKKNPVLEIADAVQPLDAWSRANWEVTKKEQFSEIHRFLQSGEGTALQRCRLIEALVDGQDLYDRDLLATIVKDKSPLVRSRVAWALRYRRDYDTESLLVTLLKDENSLVRLNALESIYFRNKPLTDEMQRLIEKQFADPDKRVRLAALMLISSRMDGSVEGNWKNVRQSNDAKTRLSTDLLTLQKSNSDPTALFHLLVLLERNPDTETVLQVVRLLILNFGDWCLNNPPGEVYSAYAFQNPPKERSAILKQLVSDLKQHFPSKDPRLNMEIPRFLAMMEDDDASLIPKLLSQVTKESDPTNDLHYLIVLSRLKVKGTPEQAKPIADALLNLAPKLNGKQLRIKQTWDERLGEMIANLLKQTPALATEMMKHPKFADPVHVGYALRFEPKLQLEAAHYYLGILHKEGDFLWTSSLVELLAKLPPEEFRPMFRKNWNEYGLRESMLVHLAKNPEETDRERYLWGLESPTKSVQLLCLKSLQELKQDDSPKNLVPVLKLLRQAFREPKDKDVVAACLTLVNRQMKQNFSGKEEKTLFEWFAKNHAKEALLITGEDGEEIAKWNQLLPKVDWEKGDANRGEKLFQTRSCASCHQASSRVGPDLGGISSRFSREDLFNAILYPNRDVAPAFRVNAIELQNGTTIHGLVVFESADGLIVQLDAVKTQRIATADMVSRKVSSKSLMPSGLMKDLKPEDFADLYSFLKGMKSQ